ncbi:MAG TPA: DUF2934 domain-containing protein [Devosia sp.]|nr:DUF2934 domain-containing protein [Devosia sp.]
MQSNNDGDPWVDRNFEAAVRDTAYFLWENDGRPFGREQEYWFAALEKCLRQREADGLLQQGPDGGEADDNIDDLGRPVNDPKGKRLDQPTGGNEVQDEP